ncbi:MAG: PspC domain-containing protein [Sphingomonadales bacterium]|nr:PspC domain-containing protein [Sphingomonadales bacterium]
MRNKFYLNKRDGKLMGVCAGLADYTGIDALWIRIAAAVLVLAGFGALLLVYLIVGLAADKRPDALTDLSGAERGSLTTPWRDSGLGDVEHYYSASNPRLSREIDGLR